MKILFFMFFMINIGAISCTSLENQKEQKSLKIITQFENKMHSIDFSNRGQQTKSLPSERFLQDDLSFIKILKNKKILLIQKCTNAVLIKNNKSCSEETVTLSLHDYSRRLKIAFRIEHFDKSVQEDKSDRGSIKQKTTINDGKRQINDAENKIKQLQDFFDSPLLNTSHSEWLNQLNSHLNSLHLKVSQKQKFTEIIQELNRIVEKWIEAEIQRWPNGTFRMVTTQSPIELNVLRSFLQTNVVSAAYIPIQPGLFKMGSHSTEAHRDPDETLHQVKLTKPFEISATEISQLEWVMIMGFNPSYFKEEQDCPNTFLDWYGIPLCADLPVERVSWLDIEEFLIEYNKRQKDVYTYRLPSEAEWEYSARSGTQTTYATGDDPTTLNTIACYAETSPNQTCPVASRSANSWGVYDMHGNVWEWVYDRYEPYSENSQIDPMGAKTGQLRVGRGGSWPGDKTRQRAANRGYDKPDGGSDGVGFRLARFKNNQ